MGVPAQTIAFLLVANQFDLAADVSVGKEAVLGAVEYEDLSINAEGRNDVGILRLVTGLVDLAGVVNLLRDLELDGHAGLGVSANLAAVLVKIFRIGDCGLGYLHLGNLKMIRDAFGSVCAEKQAVSAIGAVFGLRDVWEPLGGKSRPLERGAVPTMLEHGRIEQDCLGKYLRIMS